MIESESQNIVYEFGPFRLDPADFLMWRDGEIVPVQPKVFELLVVLLERHGHTVEKETLRQILWPNVSVDETSLTQLVFQLRKTLDEKSSQLMYVETIPKRGYRFVGDVVEVRRGQNSTVASDSYGQRNPFPSGEEQVAHDPSRLSAQRTLKVVAWASLGIAAIAVAVLSITFFWRHRVREASVRTFPFNSVDYRKLTATGKASLPAISPDGKVTAYVVDDAGKQAIWVRQLATTSRVQITQPSQRSIFGLTFSIDGESLFFVEK
jgi:DNA-binding winged helix-turn-helix (wHTH) protein